MSSSDGAEPGWEVPTFSECVIGYRSWAVGDDGQLWPLSANRRPWKPGVNTARCNCTSSDRLHFEWSWVAGRRVLEPAPQHAAPAMDCRCGLYSLRRPQGSWQTDRRYAAGSLVSGAVASWGRVQVHRGGVRAEHACVVALAYPENGDQDTVSRLRATAARYGVALVAFSELEQTAAEHGAPLPDSIHDRAENQVPQPPADEPAADRSWTTISSPDASIAEVDRAQRSARRPDLLRPRHLGVLLAVILAALIAAVIVFDHRSTPCRLQIIDVGAGGSIERCLSTTSHH